MTCDELVIATERLHLRRWQDDDVEPLARILLHPDVAPWIGAVGATVDDVASALTTPDNNASRRVMVKCGLELRGTTSWKGSTHVWYARDATGS
ncbi:MAG TPA: hypothetical protein VH572_01740 [Gaiella sp.]|jgi:RimJ/RimL family protein N-acetyltransferase